MRTLFSRAIQVDPSFHVALGVIVTLAIAEVFFASSYYVGRARANRISTQPITAAVARPQAASSPSAPAATQPSVSPAVVSNTPPPSIVDQLLQEGKQLRERGDTTDALARFQEALDSEPDNTAVLQEQAQTYESMQLFDRANDVWRRIKEISPSDSATYALADRRLKVGVPPQPTVESGGGPAETDLPARKDIGGNPDGPIMGISEVKTTQTPDPEAETNLTLQISIKKQPNTTIDYTKVRVLVYPYDIVDDKDIKLTDADVNFEWLTPKHDWSEANPEVLQVHYVRAKTSGLSDSSLSEAAAKVRPGQKGRGSKNSTAIGQRKYLGYIVRVYYGDDLQAVQAEPARLLQQFPASKSPSER
jgi:tetratricopeptide (TPR) repeat protein